MLRRCHDPGGYGGATRSRLRGQVGCPAAIARWLNVRTKARFSRLVAASLLAVLLLPAVALPRELDVTIARAVSVQGAVESQRAGASQWEPVKLNDAFSAGDTIRVRKRSRAD